MKNNLVKRLLVGLSISVLLVATGCGSKGADNTQGTEVVESVKSTEVEDTEVENTEDTEVESTKDIEVEDTENTEDIEVEDADSSVSDSESHDGDSHSHTCSWQAVYDTVHHDAVYETKWVDTSHEVVIQEAWVEPSKVVEVCVCHGCGHRSYTGEDTINHQKQYIGIHDVAFYTTHELIPSVEHPAITEWVQEGHWEDVLIKPAWSEQVLVGYKCSECGKTK